MSERPLDEQTEHLVAALYGELSPAEEDALRRELAADPALRAEYEELAETRAVMGSWEIEDPESTFLLPAGDAPSGWGGRIRRAFRGPALTWGFAGATAALAVLLVAGFRVDRVDHGLVFRFGPEPVAAPAPDTASGPASLGPGVVLPPGPRAVPVAEQGVPVTREDLDRYAGGLMQAMSGLLDNYQERRNAELAYILKGFYDSMTAEQQKKYEELRAQVHGVGLGLLAEQSATNAALKDLMQRGAPPATPLNIYEEEPPLNRNEDKQ
jgi:hypothetical protein